MTDDEFWALIELARADLGANGSPELAEEQLDGEELAEELVEVLATQPPGTIVAFGRRFDQLHDAMYRWDVWAAAYLIGGGCSDDCFIDFRAGVIALGRSWYEQVLVCPDALADHPAVRRAARDQQDDAVFAESMAYAAREAMEQRTGDEAAYDELLDDLEDQAVNGRERGTTGQWGAGGDAESPGTTVGGPAGEDFDFDDDAQMRRRLPRLAALYLSQ